MANRFRWSLAAAAVAASVALTMAQGNECDPYFKPVCGDIQAMVQAEPDLGVSIAGSIGGKLSYATFNKTTTGQPIQHDMLFEVGSITKTFTGARILQLVQSGRLSLDTPISKILPADEVFYQPNLPGNLTVRQLLNFTAGLDDYVLSYYTIAPNLGAFWPMRNMTSAGYYKTSPMTGAPCYTSSNSLLLGLIVDRLNGGDGSTRKPLVTSFHQSLFTPAGLTHTTIGGYEPTKPIDSCTNINYLGNTPPGSCQNPALKKYSGAGEAPNDSQTAYLSFAGPAGGIISTSGDIAKWFRWLFHGGPGAQMVADRQLIGVREPTDPNFITWYKCGAPQAPWPYTDPKLVKVEVGYNMQINTMAYPGKKVTVYAFLGGTLSFNGYVLYMPEYDKAFSVLVNNFNAPTATSKLDSTAKVYEIASRLVDFVVTGK